MSLLAEFVIRSSVILVIGLVAAALLRHRSAALRHAVLASAIMAAAALAPLGALLPGWHLQLAAPAPIEHVQPAASRSSDHVPARVSDSGQPPGRRFPAAATFVAAGWALGFLICAGVLLVAFRRLARTTARARAVPEGRWLRVAARVSATYQLARPVAILQTDTPDLLATWGVFRPCVLLPAGARDWTDERVHAVLCHELAHVQRHDWIVQIGAELLRTVCWFNPLAWMACTRLRRESEQACDDAVLQCGVPARAYAAHLLDLARTCRRSPSRWAPAMAMARPSTLEGRIAAMLNPRLDRTVISRRALVVTAALTLGLALPLAALRAGQSAPLPLVGTVYDATGAVLPGVELTLEDAQEVQWQTTTDSVGRFEFPLVSPGSYELQASIPGFRPLRQPVQLTSARDWDRVITLGVGELTETVTISASRAAPPAVTPGEVPHQVRVGGNIRAPTKLHHVNPLYPSSMREAGREGIVPIEAVIGADGAVHAARVLTAQVHPDFATAALEAVRQWLFSPTLLNGHPVEVRMTVSVRFSLAE